MTPVFDFPPRPFRLEHFHLPPSLRVLVLGPHPDDFEAMGLALRLLQGRGHPLRLLVLSSSANGVEDSFCNPPAREVKEAVREEEQRRSLAFFGLPREAFEFLRLDAGDEGGYILDRGEGFETVRARLEALDPDLLFLPHGDDTNPDHRLTFRWMRQWAIAQARRKTAFLVRDPKTISFRDDAFLPFGEEEASWKAELLRFHRSQHQRNLNTRGHGFDERILRVNRDNARRLGIPEPYAEAFEIVSFSAKSD